MIIDVNKISTIIDVLTEGLKSKDSYRIICKINPIELQELKKHFNAIDDGEIRGNQILIFSKK